MRLPFFARGAGVSACPSIVVVVVVISSITSARQSKRRAAIHQNQNWTSLPYRATGRLPASRGTSTAAAAAADDDDDDDADDESANSANESNAIGSGKSVYRGLVAHDEASTLDAGTDGHLGALDVDETLESGVAGLRVRQVLGLEHELPGHSARNEHVLLVGRLAQPRAVSGAVRHQVRRVLQPRQKTTKNQLEDLLLICWTRKVRHVRFRH